jgi:predicted xylose isomerase-like sugar epimerase
VLTEVNATSGIQTLHHLGADDAAEGAKLYTAGCATRTLALCPVNWEDVEPTLGSSKRGRAHVVAV